MIAPDERDTRYKEEMARFSMMTKNSVRLLYDLIMWITLIILFIVIMSQQLGTTKILLNTDLKMKQCQQRCDCQRRFAPSSLQRFPESISVRGMSLGEVDVGMERNEATG